MNQNLETPLGADEHFASPALAVAEKGSILLLEDDDSLREVITDFLTDSGYTVVAVPNGAEGIRKMLAEDFAVILCDLMMPTLPGDMFYRAAERIRPRLCDRFVFMSGGTQNQQASDFIQSVNGYVLRKPFPLNLLLDSIALAEVRRDFQSVFDDPATTPAPAPVVPSEAPQVARIKTVPQAIAVVNPPPRLTPGHPVDPVRSPPPVLRSRAPARRSKLRVISATLAVLALFPVTASYFHHRERTIEASAAAAVANARGLEAALAELAPQLAEAERELPKSAAIRRQVERLAEERAAAAWTAALRDVATCAGPQIDLNRITARGIGGSGGTCELRLEGIATGPAPRAIASEFLQASKRELDRTGSGRIAPQFDRLEDEPGASPAHKFPSASFILTVTVGLKTTPLESGAVIK